jgi:DNA-binding response OmpR family regulator
VSTTHKNSRVLIVEDEFAIAHTLQMKLQHSGYTAEVAGNGEEALALFEKDAHAFDVVLLDLIMPVMNGFDFLEALRGKGISVPVIVSSNLSQDEDVQRAKDLGAADYYVKSEVSVSDVVGHVERLLHKKHNS